MICGCRVLHPFKELSGRRIPSSRLQDGPNYGAYILWRSDSLLRLQMGEFNDEVMSRCVIHDRGSVDGLSLLRDTSIAFVIS